MAIYHFLIDRRTLWGLIAAGTLVGALLFFAGLLVGLHQNLPAPSAQLRTDGVQTAAVPATAGATPTRPTAPSVSAPSASGPAVSGPAGTGTSAPTVRVQASATSSPSASVSGPHIRRPVVRRPVVRRPTGRRPALASASRGTSTTVTPSSSPGSGTAQNAAGAPGPEASEDASGGETSAPAEPAAGTPVAAIPEPREQEQIAPAPPPMPTAFSIQVGAYRETRYLEAALEDLRSRGYSPYIVPITGSGGLVFRTVRIGRYRTREEAVRAAAEFHHKEAMTALVRKANPEMLLSSLPDKSPPEEPPSIGL